MNKVLQEAVANIEHNHRKIIDDWCKAYLAQLYEEGVDIKPGCFTLLEQVPTIHNGVYVKKYWFEPGIPNFEKNNVSEERGLMDNYWKDIWKEEPPRNKDILFMTGDKNQHIGCIFREEKLRKCNFHSYHTKLDYDCDGFTPLDERVLYWYPLPKLKED